MKDRTFLVIDASVARAAGGEDAQHPTSMHCRDFLAAVLRICNRMVLTPSVLAEWKRHRSRFARQWHVSMVAHKKVRLVADAPDEALKQKILLAAESENDREAMAKDFHLVDIALKSDQIVVSLDHTVFQLFSKSSAAVGEIKEIMWINPTVDPPAVINWLEVGTPPEKERKLGYQTHPIL